jgi:hypothetical protein
MRDGTLRASLMPAVLPKLMSILHAQGPGSHDVCHFVSAVLHVYVLDADCMKVMAAADMSAKGSKEPESGVVRLVKQCLASLDHMVGLVEAHKTSSTSLQEVRPTLHPDCDAFRFRAAEVPVESSGAWPQHRSREDGLIHPEATSRTNLATAFRLLSRAAASVDASTLVTHATRVRAGRGRGCRR